MVLPLVTIKYLPQRVFTVITYYNIIIYHTADFTAVVYGIQSKTQGFISVLSEMWIHADDEYNLYLIASSASFGT